MSGVMSGGDVMNGSDAMSGGDAMSSGDADTCLLVALRAPASPWRKV